MDVGTITVKEELRSCERKNPPGVWNIGEMGPGMEEMATEAFLDGKKTVGVFVFGSKS